MDCKYLNIYIYIYIYQLLDHSETSQDIKIINDYISKIIDLPNGLTSQDILYPENP